MGQRQAAALNCAPVLALVGLLLAGCATGTAPPTTGGSPTTAAETPAATRVTRATEATPSPGASPSDASSSASSSSSLSGPTPRGARLDTWPVGAHPLPLRPDGFGMVLPTPRELRVRRMQAADLLPPPADEEYHATVGRVTPAVRRRMGQTWSAACPVALRDLRYLTLTFQGFDGRPHTGELVVNASVAAGVVEVFRKLYAAGFPIEQMRLVTTADLDAPPTGDGNNTAAYVCRATRQATSFSAHAYGLAIDVNPFLNPYRSGDLVLPELAGAYLDRSWRRPGMVLPGSVATDAFAAAGWTWGGDFRTVSDLMHFSANGR